jgi:hypothetical protein
MGAFLKMKGQPLQGGNVILYMILLCCNIGSRLSIEIAFCLGYIAYLDEVFSSFLVVDR